jgi:hypothetical protein
MRTGKVAHKLGRSAVHNKCGISVILQRINWVQMEKLLDEFLNFRGRDQSCYLSISNFFILQLTEE